MRGWLVVEVVVTMNCRMNASQAGRTAVSEWCDMRRTWIAISSQSSLAPLASQDLVTFEVDADGTKFLLCGESDYFLLSAERPVSSERFTR